MKREVSALHSAHFLCIYDDILSACFLAVFLFLGATEYLKELMRSMEIRRLFQNGEYVVIYPDVTADADVPELVGLKYLWG